MKLAGSQTFVGFGFGPIQAGLFVLEALRSGHFARIVIAEVLPDVVRAVRAEGGRFRLNIAHQDRVESLRLGPIEIEDPARDEDRGRLVDAIAAASEVATAVPSVRFYVSEGSGGIGGVLAAGLRRRFSPGPGREPTPIVVYAAENHNRAAEILQETVLAEIPPAERDRVLAGAQFLNTVIGKMSGTISPALGTGLAPVTPREDRAFLVESFNRILISGIRFDARSGFQRGIEVFEEKPDLLPFEEAKLYGHNAAHALAAYIALRLGLVRIGELREVEGAVAFLRAAFLEESGGALTRKWSGVDPLFTAAGYRAYADDLIDRMLNPFLGDLVERVARDPARKLGWEDRLVGTIRVALGQGIEPRRFALGTAAALAVHAPGILAEEGGLERELDALWRDSSPDPAERHIVVRLLRGGLAELRAWEKTGSPPFAA